jgi:hypothetical protein
MDPREPFAPLPALPALPQVPALNGPLDTITDPIDKVKAIFDSPVWKYRKPIAYGIGAMIAISFLSSVRSLFR